ncbi:MAG TPA: 4Fe-4S dicluster domain-containing protein, partial [Firmicutes bacterium]|nr:4Fe-4S dicluster domain-containing protein [Bacillota bacterium]
CIKCKVCIDTCPYEARFFDEEDEVVKINEILCQGCGACIVACPTGATQQKNLADVQLIKMVEVIFGKGKESDRRDQS